MKKSLVVLAAAVTLIAGCKVKKALDQAAISNELKKTGTTDLLQQVSQDKYDPPANGRLTEAQVGMYLKVREHEKDIARVAHKEMEQHAEEAKKAGEKSVAGMMEGFKALGSVADLATADVRAAKDLGYNTQEYLWVKGQILAASAAAMAEKTTKSLQAAMDSTYQQMKKQYDTATDPQMKKVYAEAMAGYEQQKKEAGAAQEDPAVTFNRQLLASHENELNAIATEWSKFEDKEGETARQMKKFEQETQKAK